MGAFEPVAAVDEDGGTAGRALLLDNGFACHLRAAAAVHPGRYHDTSAAVPPATPLLPDRRGQHELDVLRETLRAVPCRHGHFPRCRSEREPAMQVQAATVDCM